MILTKEQARAVYDAMCALNNVHCSNGGLAIEIYGEVSGEAQRLRIAEGLQGVVTVEVFCGDCEHHASQAMFHLAYDL